MKWLPVHLSTKISQGWEDTSFSLVRSQKWNAKPNKIKCIYNIQKRCKPWFRLPWMFQCKNKVTQSAHFWCLRWALHKYSALDNMNLYIRILDLNVLFMGNCLHLVTYILNITQWRWLASANRRIEWDSLKQRPLPIISNTQCGVQQETIPLHGLVRKLLM